MPVLRRNRNDRSGSWLCENARQRGLMGRDFSEVAAISHLAEFGAFSFGKGLRDVDASASLRALF